MLLDVSPGHMAAGVPRIIQLVSWEATHNLLAPSEDCFGAGGPQRAALFGLSVGQQVQPIPAPGLGPPGEWLDAIPGREEGRG